MTEEHAEIPKLHPLYRPAVTDSILTIHFIGNTAVVGRLGFAGDPGVDPYQMLGAAEELKRKAFQMLQMAEMEEAKAREQKRIQVTGKLPSEGQFLRPDQLSKG